MNRNDIKVYIAAPFFNKEELDFVKEIESVFDVMGVDYFSPRKHGVVSEIEGEHRDAKMKRIYDLNIKGMRESTVMLAVIDNRDTGTMFEMGYYTKMMEKAKERYMISITNKDYDINVMLRYSINGHMKLGCDDLKLLLSDVKRRGKLDLEMLSLFDQFSQRVY